MNNFSELKYRFNYASPTLQLIFINAGVFIFASLFNLILFLFLGVKKFLSPSLSLVVMVSSGALLADVVSISSQRKLIIDA